MLILFFIFMQFHVLLEVFTSVSDKPTALIFFYPEDGGSRFL
jgi:hypothetical protein